MCDTPAFAADKDAAAELAEKLRAAVPVATRRYYIWSYQKCFVGNVAVDRLIQMGYAKDRQEAVRIGQRLMDHNLLRHVADEQKFKDQEIFYRFKVDDVPGVGEDLSPSSLIAGCNGVTSFGPVLLSATFGWKPRYLILKANERRLLVYEAQTDTTPSLLLILDDETTAWETKDAKSGQFGWSVRTAKKSLNFCSESELDRTSWLSSLGNSGVMIGKQVDMLNQVSLYQFSAHDIDGAPVNLSEFAGKVSLVVNVACE
jgi:hypothetical protein